MGSGGGDEEGDIASSHRALHNFKVRGVIKESSLTSNLGKNYAPGRLFYPLLVWDLTFALTPFSHRQQ